MSTEMTSSRGAHRTSRNSWRWRKSVKTGRNWANANKRNAAFACGWCDLILDACNLLFAACLSHEGAQWSMITLPAQSHSVTARFLLAAQRRRKRSFLRPNSHTPVNSYGLRPNRLYFFETAPGLHNWPCKIVIAADSQNKNIILLPDHSVV